MPASRASEIAPAAVFGPHHQLDRIAGGVAEKDHVPDLAQLALLRRPAANAVAQALKLCARLIEIGGGRNFEGNRLVGRITLEIAEGMGAGIRLEVYGLLVPLRDLETQDLGCEDDRSFKIARSESAIADIPQVDHVGSPSAAYSIMAHSLDQAQKELRAWANCLGSRCGWSGAKRSPSAT